MTATWEALAAALAGVPRLHGAECGGRHELFDPPAPDTDPDDADYIIHTALRLCASCTALASCSRWFESLPERQRPPGVVAGRLNVPPRPGRPKAAGGIRLMEALHVGVESGGDFDQIDAEGTA